MRYSDFSIPTEKASILPVVYMPVYSDIVKEIAKALEDNWKENLISIRTHI